MWELDYKESWVPKNWCFWTVVLEKTLESLLGWRRSNQCILKEISPEYSLEGWMLKLKLQYLATWCEELTYLKRPCCWERLKVGGEGDDRRRDGWMASPTEWTWVWVSSKSWWWTGKPGVLQSMGSQRVGHDWTTDLNSCWRSASLCGSAGKESAWSAGDLGSIPGLGRSPGEGKGYQPQYSGLENSMDCRVHGVAKSPTWLSDFHYTGGNRKGAHGKNLALKVQMFNLVIEKSRHRK